jgi:hypothetical protein
LEQHCQRDLHLNWPGREWPVKKRTGPDEQWQMSARESPGLFARISGSYHLWVYQSSTSFLAGPRRSRSAAG